MLVTVLDVVIAGLLLGGLYALIAMGLSLQYGVARVLNVSHGEFIMLGGMITWTLYTRLGLNPLVALALCGPLTFLLGFILHRTIFRVLAATAESPGVFEANSMLASFGLLFIVQNLALVIWGPEIRAYTYLARPVNLSGAVFAANRLLTLSFAAVIGLVFYVYLARTRMGKAIRAAAQDRGAAYLMGIDINYVLALCFALGAALAGIAGMLISMSYPVNALMGFEYTTIAIIVVVLGGLGSIPGSFIGGFLLGLVGSVVTYFQPGLALAAYYAIFILLLLARPTGLMGK
jgi:branched-chain amino acid transport system permease protein